MDIPTSYAITKICLRASGIWLLSMILAIPEAVFSDLHIFHIPLTNETFQTCAPYPQTGDLRPKIHSMASFLIFYLIPLFIISVYYFFIARSLIRSSINIPVEGKMPIRRQVRYLREGVRCCEIIWLKNIPAAMLFSYLFYKIIRL